MIDGGRGVGGREDRRPEDLLRWEVGIDGERGGAIGTEVRLVGVALLFRWVVAWEGGNEMEACLLCVLMRWAATIHGGWTGPGELLRLGALLRCAVGTDGDRCGAGENWRGRKFEGCSCGDGCRSGGLGGWYLPA